MNKSCDYKFKINYKSADNAYHVTSDYKDEYNTGPINAYLVNEKNECYLVYPELKINLIPGTCIFHPLDNVVYVNLNVGCCEVDLNYKMPELLVDNLKTTSSESLI